MTVPTADWLHINFHLFCHSVLNTFFLVVGHLSAQHEKVNHGFFCTYLVQIELFSCRQWVNI